MLLEGLFSAMLLVQSHPQRAPLLQPEGKELTLTGRISLVRGYGPPGWGEDKQHDARITYWVIDLPVSINTPCIPERPEWEATDCQSTKRLRLILEGNDALTVEAKAVKGQNAIVRGVLHRSDTVGEITPIFMDVLAIKPER